jgi:hypothetical protein
VVSRGICWQGVELVDDQEVICPGTGTDPADLVVNQPVAVVAADFNNDDDPDLAVAAAGDDTLRVYTGGAGGTFALAQVLSLPGNPTAVAAGDIEGDGDTDLAVTIAGNPGMVVLYLKNSVNTFQPGGSAFVGNSPSGVAIGELTSEGFADIAVSNATSSTVSIVRNAGFPCPWDLSGDGTIRIIDLLQFFVDWGPCPGCIADFDGNGNVGVSDLLELLAHWGGCP